jgi:hypothetical protein
MRLFVGFCTKTDGKSGKVEYKCYVTEIGFLRRLNMSDTFTNFIIGNSKYYSLAQSLGGNGLCFK